MEDYVKRSGKDSLQLMDPDLNPPQVSSSIVHELSLHGIIAKPYEFHNTGGLFTVTICIL